MELRLITALFVVITTVSARDHHLRDGNLQQLEDGDYHTPHGNYRFPDIFPEEEIDDINGFYPGNNLPRPDGFNSLAGFSFPSLPKEESPHLPINDSVDYVDGSLDSVNDSVSSIDLSPVDPEGAATNITDPILDPSSPQLDDDREPQFDIEPPFYGRPEPFRVGRPFFRQPGGRRATRRPGFFSASTPSQAVVRTPGRGIVRGSGPFGRTAPTHVNEPGVAGFMKSFRRLIRTYI